MLLDTFSLKIKKIKSESIIWIILTSFFIGVIFWLLASLRHFFLQSNAFDLGLFDQWLWLQASSHPPYSSMTGLHILADHGAWILYFPVFLYKIHPNIQWLLASQAFALSFTSVPIWILAKQRDLSDRESWLICWLWWLQPVVFNVNIFDFHPEVWSMPCLAFAYWSLRSNKPLLWILLLFITLGTRDGLLLLTLGLGIEQLIRRSWVLGFSAISLSLIWLIFLNNFLYPFLNQGQGTVMAISRYSYLGGSIGEILVKVITNPIVLLQNIDWSGSIFYLFILFLPFIFFLRGNSLITLTSSIPLLLTNILSDTFSQRTLIHHYSLPIVLILVIASIDGLSEQRSILISIKKRFLWILIVWSLLAKPWFFFGPYLDRISSIKPARQAFKFIRNDSSVLTTSYLAPHITQRRIINFPKDSDDINNMNQYDVILLNPLDPGWNSGIKVQQSYLTKAKVEGWNCTKWQNGLELCLKN